LGCPDLFCTLDEVRSLRVADVLDLAAAQSEDSEDRLQKIFEWSFERTLTAARLLFGVAASILAAWLAALLRPDSSLDGWERP
jgi:hypothetical protein